jgi:hypothetical protein
LTGMPPPAYRTAAMTRVSVARKTWIDSPFRGATDKFRLLGVLAAALAIALSAPAVALGTVQVAPTLTGTAGDDDWFTSNVIVKWTYSGETSTTGCDTQELTTDTPGTTLSCTAAAPGQAVTSIVTVHIDQTPPAAVVATPARPPDVGLFYTAPLPISWSATDATSGIATCTTLTYAGPDGLAVAPTGTCRDRAGNVSAPLASTFSYGTPPTPAPVIAAATAAPTSTAGPTATSTTAKSKANAKAKRPTLTWRARSKVKYYNLQLFRNGRKILSAWPTVAHYTLKPSWRYHGHTYKLTAGRYRWYVWPGYGPRSAHRYGRLLTKGAVTVPKS